MFEPGPAERADIDRQRSDRSRLGFAVQLGCVRFLGLFPDLSAVPGVVVEHVVANLGIRATSFAGNARSRTRFAHVVVCARRAGQGVVTSDPDDLRALDPKVRLIVL